MIQTPVIFRVLTTDHGGDVIALFPTEPARFGHVLSYQHIGQHAETNYQGVIAVTRPATPAEYRELLDEPDAIGYSCKVYKRRPANMRPRQEYL